MSIKICNILMLLITGIIIGWLTGLSVSPIIAVVITSIIGIVVPLVSVKDENGRYISPNIENISIFPVFLLIIGIAAGSALGIKARTHNWLENISEKTNKHEDTKKDSDTGKTRLYSNNTNLCSSIDIDDPDKIIENAKSLCNQNK